MLRALAEREAFCVVWLDSMQSDDACLGGGRTGCETDCGAPEKQTFVVGVTRRRNRTASQTDRTGRHFDAGRSDRRNHQAATPPALMYTEMRLGPWREPGLRAMGNFHDCVMKPGPGVPWDASIPLVVQRRPVSIHSETCSLCVIL